jgi:hypothetical protein
MNHLPTLWLSSILDSRFTLGYLVTWQNKPMLCVDPQTPQDGVLTNKTAGIQGFVEVKCAETHFRGGAVFILQSYTRVLYPL